jgi:hypothetical protein
MLEHQNRLLEARGHPDVAALPRTFRLVGKNADYRWEIDKQTGKLC